MKYNKQQLWERFKRYYTEFPEIGLAMDLSRMNFGDDFLPSMESRMQKAFIAMGELEKGGIANPDENRMVGHYWLRNPALAPTQSIRHDIESTIATIKSFAADVHSGKIVGTSGPFKHLLVIGIGGSALGPQFVSKALGNASEDEMIVHFLITLIQMEWTPHWPIWSHCQTADWDRHLRLSFPKAAAQKKRAMACLKPRQLMKKLG